MLNTKTILELLYMPMMFTFFVFVFSSCGMNVKLCKLYISVFSCHRKVLFFYLWHRKSHEVYMIYNYES